MEEGSTSIESEKERIKSNYTTARKIIYRGATAGLVAGALVTFAGIGGALFNLRSVFNPYNNSPGIVAYRTAGERIENLESQREELECMALLAGAIIDPKVREPYQNAPIKLEQINAEISELTTYRQNASEDPESDLSKSRNWDDKAELVSVCAIPAGFVTMFGLGLGSIPLSEAFRRRKDRRIAELSQD